MSGRSLEDYVDVAERLAQYAQKHPHASLTAEILEDDGKRVLIRAVAEVPVVLEGGQVYLKRGIGHAEEIRGAGMVNKTSAIENGETSAWGRALAALGFSTSKGVASRQEMEKVERMTNVVDIKTKKTLTPAAVTRLLERIKDADPGKVQLELAAFGVTDLPELTIDQAKDLIAKVAA